MAVRAGFQAAIRIAVLLLGLMITLPLAAEEQTEFSVLEAGFSLEDTMLTLASEVDINLPDYIKIAINQGFAVPLMFEVEILALRKYWFDLKIVRLKQQYQLHYLPMLGSYVVFDLNTGVRRYYDSLPEAVQNLEVVYNYPMLDVNNLDYNRDFYARMRFGVDIDALPLPLKSSSLWENDWNLQSDWYEWDIERPDS
ncbi:MAG: DUF4390 domain-containing protein [Gammaproteobacteria bacterium]